ncbi:MAG TPA: hypothetical protein EYH28_05845 [Anaerolineaceae bacterium]|nr:hypothetical protein [Anaerolineaceae bacterium]
MRGLNLEVRPGEIFGFLGPTVRGRPPPSVCCWGLLRPSEGETRVLGFDIRKAPHRIRPRVGYMSQRFSLTTTSPCWKTCASTGGPTA